MMLLSICIPSYNRFENLSRIIKSISKCKSKDFEVVIIDNCSPDDIEKIVPTGDSRFRIIHRERPIKGTLNCRQALDFGAGDFCMELLDKDFIDGDALDAFLNTLKEHNDVACGICALNLNNKVTNISISGFDRNLTELYKMRHPSGIFIKRCYIQEDAQCTKLIDMESANGIELVFAVALARGKCIRYNFPMVFTETEKEAAKTPSYTYNQASIWFHPTKQIEAFDRYCRHMRNLDLSRNKKIVKYLFRRLISSCTIEYRDIMKNEKICQHYLIEPMDITADELNKWKKESERHFLKSEYIDLSQLDRITIIYSESLHYKIKSVMSFLK